jgi:N6-adenosine-specific RNA methylase IME4
MQIDLSTEDFVNQRAAEIHAMLRRTAQDIVEIGGKLIEVKARLQHGQFGDWLQQEFNWGERTAQNFMAVHARFKSANFADLAIAPSALYLLASPSVSEGTAQYVIARAQAGESITYAAAKEAVQQFREIDEETGEIETAAAWLAPDAGEAETREARLERRALALEDRREALQDVPAGQYRVIYADPPWRYEHVETENRAIENHYPTLELAEICALPVSTLAADDAVLFMWATSPKLAEAMQVIEAWGFNYRTCMVWVKDAIGMGYYARQRHELLLIAVKGHPPVPATDARPDSVQEWPRGRHSEKPHLFYDLIERMYPNWARLELFARNTREGWDCWGNEVAA